MTETQSRYVFLDQPLNDKQIIGLNNLSPARVIFEKLIPKIDVSDDVERSILSPRKIMVSSNGDSLVLGYNDFAPGVGIDGYGHYVRVNFHGCKSFSVTNSSEDDPLHYVKSDYLEIAIRESVDSLKR